MSVRGPRGGRGRGRGSERGRGRGGKTMVWEWESYTPGPEVYDQLWHIRKEPAKVTPFLPTECPLPNARTRILDRRQSEGEIQRNFYIIEVTHMKKRGSSTLSDADEVTDSVETVHADLSRILEFVSPDELERFENEQFSIEAEAEEVARRAEAEEVAHRRLDNNARMAGVGKGSRMLSGLGRDAETRIRGRPRGRGRGRGRGSWRGRGALVMNGRLSEMDEDAREELVDAEPVEALLRAEDALQQIIAVSESDDDSEADRHNHNSPGIARSAFVANSALPVSPVASLRRINGISKARSRRPERPSDGSFNIDLIDADARSMSSAALQLRLEDDFSGRSDDISDEEVESVDQHRGKRRRTESTVSQRRESQQRTTYSAPHPRRTYPQLPFFSATEGAISNSDASDESIRAQPHTAVYHGIHPASRTSADHDTIAVQSPRYGEEKETNDEDDAEKYVVVEAIIEHYRESGRKYYLVKWQDYEDSHDWLPEEDLEGAAELVAEYDEKVRRRSGKQEAVK
ncbi:hypothetical protein EK21DRAFT_97980 [Setomelanomma holmii]|uniref:Chromo domain-containing protein n=1 Tax=Setomelanomma holmii TaxID=210430 RepID=A0A9P4HHW3_9PLEO|nr:hypothetical protein EK21DRAFT_97980 [Setomelanomma holmii]